MSGETGTEATRTVFDGLTPSDARAVERFDEAFVSFEPDPELLSGAAGRALGDALTDVVATIGGLDLDRLARCNTWWARFTGADLEARIQVEVSIEQLAHDMGKLSAIASKARRACDLMVRDSVTLGRIGAIHAELAHRTTAFLGGADRSNQNVARLERRLANLHTMLASNEVAIAQMKIAVAHLLHRLDQYNDVVTRLYPVWRHHALVVCQGASSDIDQDAFDHVRRLRTRITDALRRPEKESA